VYCPRLIVSIAILSKKGMTPSFRLRKLGFFVAKVEPYMSDNKPADQSRQMTPEEAADFAEQVFNKAREGDAAMLAALLSKGLPANLRNHKGDTLLMLASYHGHVEAVKVLLEHNADPEIRNDNGQSPIAGAAFKGDLEMVKTLVEGGAQVEGASFDGRTALMMAAMFNRGEIIDYLIGKGADPKAKDANGITALDAARTMGATEAVAQLEKLLG
jgi:ankyrin repeat protein